MTRHAWIPWIGGTLILLAVGGIALAILGTYWGDPDLSARGTDILKVMVTGLFGFLAGMGAGGRQSGPRAGPAHEGLRAGGNEVRN